MCGRYHCMCFVKGFTYQGWIHVGYREALYLNGFKSNGCCMYDKDEQSLSVWNSLHVSFMETTDSHEFILDDDSIRCWMPEHVHAPG